MPVARCRRPCAVTVAQAENAHTVRIAGQLFSSMPACLFDQRGFFRPGAPITVSANFDPYLNLK